MHVRELVLFGPQNGNVWEKAGVNVSVVYGSMPPEAYRAATGADLQKAKVRRQHPSPGSSSDNDSNAFGDECR